MKGISIGQFACGEVRELSDAHIDNEFHAETNLKVLRYTRRRFLETLPGGIRRF